MPARPRRSLLVPLLALACYALALAQRPGRSVSDTKIDLQVDPLRFLADALAPWSSDISLGHVQSGQYGGYAFPQGPFFALWREIGISGWVTERLWLGTLLFLAGWGVVRLLDVLLTRRRGAAHVTAAALLVLNPYVVTYMGRVSVSLLAYAALPWLLLAVHRGLRAGRGTDGKPGTGWLWPAIFALIVTSSGGGINAAVTAWVLLGPLLLLIYEVALGEVVGRAAWGWVWRTALLGAVTSVWWVVPLLVQAKWGLPFLPYTEQAGTIWGTTSASESLRLMGFWLSYVGTGYGGRLTPYATGAGTLVFWAPGMVASLLVAPVALGGFAWTRRWRYAPFFLGMVIIGVLVMIAGFPEGTPLRRGMTFAYNHLVSLQFLRTTYKAGPLVALGLAVLGGAAVGLLWTWLAAHRPRLWRPVLVVGGVAVVALAAWPIVRGRGVDDQLTWRSIPASWRAVAADLDRLPDDHRAMVLPGQLFSAYTWGVTVDPILPTLARRPVAVRQVVPFADLRSVDLQWATDALITQRRALPGQLAPLLALQSVDSVVTGSDDDRARSGALGANAAARELTRAGLAPPVATYGTPRPVPAQAGDLAAPLVLAPVVRRSIAGSPSMVRLLPRAGAVVVDGSADALVELAAFGRLPRDRALRYAADLTAAQTRALAATGSPIVVSDSNRRRVFVPSRLRGNTGATLAAQDPISADGHQLNPWPGLGTDAQTVAQLSGARYVRAPFSPQVTQFPEHRPFAAVDGDPRTAWLADRTLSSDGWYLEVGLDGRRDVPTLDLMPYSDGRGRVRSVLVNGTPYRVHRGWNRLPVRLRAVDTIRITMGDVTRPAGASAGAGGIRELRIPGVRVTEALRVPRTAERALPGASLAAAPLTYLFSRTRGDDPFHRETVHGAWQATYVRDQGDAEAGLERLFTPPAPRRWTPQAWVTVSARASDPFLDRLAGGAGPDRYASSDRFQGLPANRASGAFDRDPRTAWIGGWTGGPGARRPFLRWTTTTVRTVRVLQVRPAVGVRRPTRVRLSADGVGSGPLVVGADGTVRAPRPLTGRVFRLDVLDAAFPAGTSGVVRRRRAVGLSEVRGAGVPRATPRRTGPLAAVGCPVVLRVGGRAETLRVTGAVPTLDAGLPLRASPCGPPIALAPVEQHLSAPASGPFAVDLLALDAPAPAPVPAPAPAGTVLDNGAAGHGRRTGIRLAVRRPGWLVWGESYSAGWRATCDGRSLGAPVPIQGYAVGWPVAPGCTAVDITFAGNRPVALAGWISLVATLALLAFVIVGLVRRRHVPGPDPGPVPEPAGAAATPRLSLGRALAWGAAAGLAGAFVFALRAGIVIGPGVAFVLWRGIGARSLSLAAGALLAVVVPVLYLAVPVVNKGGYNGSVPQDRIAAHWVAVAALVLLMLALTRAVVERGRTRPPDAGA